MLLAPELKGDSRSLIARPLPPTEAPLVSQLCDKRHYRTVLYNSSYDYKNVRSYMGYFTNRYSKKIKFSYFNSCGCSADFGGFFRFLCFLPLEGSVFLRVYRRTREGLNRASILVVLI